MNSVKTSLQFDAQINLLIGQPSFFAINPAKMSPKLPEGTEKDIF